MRVEFSPSIGLVGADGVDLETLFMNLLVVSDTYAHEGVGNCLVAKNGAGIVSSWHAWNIMVKLAGIGGTSNRKHEIDAIRLMHATSQTLPCSYLPVVFIF